MIQQSAKFIMAAICLSASMPPFVHAETILFRATSDFPVIDVGEVPYYSEEPVRSSLAINAANESFREKFARATTVYEGESRFFDITLTGLAELDGEAMYRVLINDVLIGEATNPTTDTDYTEVRHTFESVVVPAGATIAVESLANTNGLIPEGDGTAYARGRWTSLELIGEDIDDGADLDVDLSITVSTSATSINVGDTVTLTLDIHNAVGSEVATNPVLSLTRPSAEIGVVDIGDCLATGNYISCMLSEIPAGGSAQVILTLMALETSPSALLRAIVSADQIDTTPDNNAITFPVPIEDKTGSVASGGSDESDGSDGSGGNGDAGDATDNTASETPDGNSTQDESDGSTDNSATTTSRSGGGLSWLFVWSLIMVRVIRLRPGCSTR